MFIETSNNDESRIQGEVAGICLRASFQEAFLMKHSALHRKP